MRDLSPWLGLCHIRNETDGTRSSQQTLVAAWADSVEAFEREVHFHTNTHGLQMILVEEVLPATEWMQKHPDRKDAQRLAAKVSAKHPVEIGTLGGGASGSGGQSDDSEGYLHIEEVEGVEPLDSQFGVHPPKTVPGALYQPLFGQPDPTRTEVAQYGSADKVPPLHTYAILDAAKVVNFVEMLEASGLEHRCLFKGEAAEEMRDVAPYVVRLEEDNTFTRNLFSHDPEQEVPWFMWSREPGIYVRSRGTLEDMWRHFRKFTKVQDEDGKWFYFRFWEGIYLDAILYRSEQAAYSGFFNNIYSCSYSFFAVNRSWKFRITQCGLPDRDATKCFVLNEKMIQSLKNINARLRAEKTAMRLEIPEAELGNFVSLAQRHYMLGYEDEQKIKISYDLFKKIVPEQHQSVWAVIEQGNDSLGFTHHRIKEHFGIKE